ncbi:MAG TPA: hypothetical protein VMZ51_05925 [Acidimicrobiales bacterium]|nr:hypothetical protein [Acidimicrobiales bacterium]
MRLPLAAIAAAAAAALAAVILGEYDLRGVTPLVSGVMLALVIGELVVVVAGGRNLVLGGVSAVSVGAGLVWALRISSGNDWSYVTVSGWAGAALGAVTAFLWVAPRQNLRGSVPRGDGSLGEP